MDQSTWYLYIIQCGDGTYYTGITTDIDTRLCAHTEGKGAKYTKGRGPFTLCYQEVHRSKSAALKREIQIKSLSKAGKKQLWQ